MIGGRNTIALFNIGTTLLALQSCAQKVNKLSKIKEL